MPGTTPLASHLAKELTQICAASGFRATLNADIRIYPPRQPNTARVSIRHPPLDPKPPGNTKRPGPVV